MDTKWPCQLVDGSRQHLCSSVQFSRSVVSDSATPWPAAHQASLSITNSRSLLKLTSIESVMPSNHLILCHPLLLLFSIFPSIRVFSNESALRIRWPEYCSFSFSISPPSEYSGLISFRIDWLDLLAVQGTLKSLLQYYSSKASVLWCSGFFMFQLSHLGIIYYNIVVFVFDSWNSSRTTRWKERASIPNKPFNHTWVYLNKMTFGKSLRMGTGCWENQPWLESWNFQ